MTQGRAFFFRRVVLMVVLAAAFAAGSAASAKAACQITDVIGQWQHQGDNSHWVFFTNNRVDCRVCLGWNGSCRYVPDPSDKLGRKQCELTGAGGGTAPVRVTGWEAESGELARILFSDGSKKEVRNACMIDGAEGIMSIQGVGNFHCHYNYQCNKIKDK